MTQIFNDNVQVDLTIDGEPWLLVDAEVELSLETTPNYAAIRITPDPEETEPNLPSDITQLIGLPFRLEADNDIISERETTSSEETLLFSGILGNITNTGEKLYEGIAYDPSQQAFEDGGGGKLANTVIKIDQPEYSYEQINNLFGGTRFESQTIKASELAEQVANTLNLYDRQIDLSENGKTVSGINGEYTGAIDTDLVIQDSVISLEKALELIEAMCIATSWFDKEGTFHIGVIEPNKHELKYITDTDAGITTPPYQAVRVIGSGSASTDGYERSHIDIEDKIVVEGVIGESESGALTPTLNEKSVENALKDIEQDDVFEYYNLEISTVDQAKNVAEDFLKKIAAQQRGGTITVVGFPEVFPRDGIVMPDAGNVEYEKNDIRNRQPMGGATYGVSKVIHRLNGDDGFITKIKVDSVVGATRAIIQDDSAERDPTNIEDVDGAIEL